MAGLLLVDAQVGLIDLRSVRYEVSGQRVFVTLFTTNPSDHDREVSLQTTLFDASGNPMGQKTVRREVEEGECGEQLRVHWKLSPGELAAATSVQVIVSSRPD